jgi:hypothetical protein
LKCSLLVNSNYKNGQRSDRKSGCSFIGMKREGNK